MNEWNDFFNKYTDETKHIVLALVKEYMKINDLNEGDLKSNLSHIKKIEDLINWHNLQIEVDPCYGNPYRKKVMEA